MSKAIISGLGGIGKNVYLPQLVLHGFDVDTIDVDPESGATYSNIGEIPEGTEYDIAVICTPNTFHLPHTLGLSDFCKKILVEKPGFPNARAWRRVTEEFLPDHEITLVKNNMYRDRSELKKLKEMVKSEDVTKVQITWFNKDRIPNPGSWFTNQSKAFGGVTHDLFPHLYTFMSVLFDPKILENCQPMTFAEQKWNLDNIGDNTDYGAVNKDGVYDVCDYAEAHYLVPQGENDRHIPVELRASWKEGVDDQTIRIHFDDGAEFVYEFGLCPDEAYGRMLAYLHKRKPGKNELDARIDLWIHEQLECFV